MVQAAYPAADIGMIIRSATAPDVLTYPELARFHWEETATGAVYRYNGSSWEYIKASVTIPNGTISLGKLAVGSATAYQILAVNNAGNEISAQDLAAVIGGSTFTTIAGYGTQLFLTISGSLGKLSGVDPSAFAAKSIGMSKILSTGTAGQYPAANGAGGWTWTTPGVFSIADKSIVIGKLASTGGTANQVIAVDGVTGGCKWYNIPAAVYTEKGYTSSQACPTVGTPITFPHGLSAIPNHVTVTLLRKAAAASQGYSQNDEIPLDFITGDSGVAAFSVALDGTNVTVIRDSNGDVLLTHKTTGVATHIEAEILADPDNWWIKVTAHVLPTL